MKCSPRNLITSPGWKPKPCSTPPRDCRCASVIQACCAFQMIGGTLHKANTPSSKYKPGRANSCRSRGARASTSKIEISSNAFVYLQRNPSPISNPVSGQCQEKRGLFSTASQNVNIAASLKKTDSESIVITNAPMLKIGVTFKATIAHQPAVALNKPRAKYNRNRLVPAAMTGLKK